MIETADLDEIQQRQTKTNAHKLSILLKRTWEHQWTTYSFVSKPLPLKGAAGTLTTYFYNHETMESIWIEEKPGDEEFFNRAMDVVKNKDDLDVAAEMKRVTADHPQTPMRWQKFMCMHDDEKGKQDTAKYYYHDTERNISQWFEPDGVNGDLPSPPLTTPDGQKAQLIYPPPPPEIQSISASARPCFVSSLSSGGGAQGETVEQKKRRFSLLNATEVKKIMFKNKTGN